MASKGTKWLDQYLLTDPTHADELEQKAAGMEFNDKIPRHIAEQKAYESYKKDQHMQGAAHHLKGLRAAQASGDRDEGRKHGAMYEMHAKQLGFEPWAEVPQELHSYLAKEKQEPSHKFKAHKGDLLVLDKQKKELEKTEIQQMFGTILKKAQQLLKGDVIQFPKARITPASDQGRTAPIAHLPASEGQPAFSAGHRVNFSGSSNVGTITNVHPATRPGEGHIYYVKFDDGRGTSAWEDQLEPHHD